MSQDSCLVQASAHSRAEEMFSKVSILWISSVDDAALPSFRRHLWPSIWVRVNTQQPNKQLPADSLESRMTMIKTKVKLIERLVALGRCSSLVGYCDDYFHNSCVRCKRLIQKLTNVCYQLRHPVEYDTLSRLAENFIVLYSTKTIRI